VLDVAEDMYPIRELCETGAVEQDANRDWYRCVSRSTDVGVSEVVVDRSGQRLQHVAWNSCSM
jgi:hypothetical protein